MPHEASSPVPFVKMREWALFALEDMAAVKNHDARLRSFEMRFLLAWLYSTAPGDREPFDQFWKHATRHIEVQGGTYAIAQQERVRCLRKALAGIYRTMGLHGEEMHQRYLQAVAERNAWYQRYWERRALAKDGETPVMQPDRSSPSRDRKR